MLSDTYTEKMAIATAVAFPGVVDEFLSLREKDFTSPEAKKGYQAIRELAKEGSEVDVVSFSRKADLEPADAYRWVSSAVSEAQIGGLVKVLKDLTRRRSIYLAAEGIINKASSRAEDTDELIAEASRIIDEASEGKAKDPEHIGEVVKRRFDNYRAGDDAERGLRTGWTDLDDVWSGFFPGELTILAARPSMGKTAFAQALSEGVAVRTDEPVLVYSLEMGSDYLGDRYISSNVGVDLDRWRRGTVTVSNERAEKAERYYDSIPLYLQDQSDITTYDIQAQARKMKKEQGLGLVVVDFLTLLADDKERGESEHLKVSAMTRRLRAMAKNLQVPVLCLAQLSRAVEQTEDKRPRLSHLRESGGIEEAADNVLFIYREGYYFKGCDHPNMAEIIVAKQKQGPRNMVAPLYYDPETGRFRNLAKGDQVA